jgi:RNA polymerase sigma-70 factor (ECF subfamily)
MIGSNFSAVLANAQFGDDRAFATMWREFQPPLLRYLRIVANHAAEDVASDTWATVTTSLVRFEGDEPAFRAWLFCLARRRAIDHVRKESRRPSIPVDPTTLRTVTATESADDPGDAALTSMSTDAALALIATLPPAQAEAVALRTIAGLDVADVAVIMQKRPGTVRVLAHRGLRELASRFSDDTRPAANPRTDVGAS